MQYDGKEIVEMSTEKWDGKVRTMLVWNCVNDIPTKERIVEWYKNKNGHVIWRDVSCKFWNYCAEIPEEINQVQTTNEMIKILNAYKRGKKIECRFRDRTMRDSWSYIEKPDWNWALYEYRVKQEPRRMTNKELKEWLKRNCGQYSIPSPNSFIGVHVKTQFGYGIEKDDELVKEGIQIRAWYESEWHEPLIEE